MCNGCIIRCKVVSVGGQYSLNFFFTIFSSSKQFLIVIRYATYDIIEPERIIAEGKGSIVKMGIRIFWIQ